jgi:hypothetical protein
LADRRSFLAMSSGAVLAAALGPAVRAQSTSNPLFSNRNLGAYTQGILTQATFESFVGSVFTVDLGDGKYAYNTLVLVKDASSPASSSPSTGRLRVPASGNVAAAAKKPSTFILNFTTGRQLVPQGSYALDHGRLGSFVAFLVPGDPVQGGTCSACFNLL